MGAIDFCSLGEACMVRKKAKFQSKTRLHMTVYAFQIFGIYPLVQLFSKCLVEFLLQLLIAKSIIQTKSYKRYVKEAKLSFSAGRTNVSPRIQLALFLFLFIRPAGHWIWWGFMKSQGEKHYCKRKSLKDLSKGVTQQDFHFIR